MRQQVQRLVELAGVGDHEGQAGLHARRELPIGCRPGQARGSLQRVACSRPVAQLALGQSERPPHTSRRAARARSGHGRGVAPTPARAPVGGGAGPLRATAPRSSPRPLPLTARVDRRYDRRSVSVSPPPRRHRHLADPPRPNDHNEGDDHHGAEQRHAARRTVTDHPSPLGGLAQIFNRRHIAVGTDDRGAVYLLRPDSIAVDVGDEPSASRAGGRARVPLGCVPSSVPDDDTPRRTQPRAGREDRRRRPPPTDGRWGVGGGATDDRGVRGGGADGRAQLRRAGQPDGGRQPPRRQRLVRRGDGLHGRHRRRRRDGGAAVVGPAGDTTPVPVHPPQPARPHAAQGARARHRTAHRGRGRRQGGAQGAQDGQAALPLGIGPDALRRRRRGRARRRRHRLPRLRGRARHVHQRHHPPALPGRRCPQRGGAVELR